MPPLRRYLRITQYSVLECRIYLDNPADLHRWLLNENAPVLPRVIAAVRPLVLPKLREENARAKAGKGGKKKGWKDVVVEGMSLSDQVEICLELTRRFGDHPDDFEVSVFLTEVSARHAILRKEKRVKSEKAKLGTTEGRFTGEGTRDVPVEIGDGGADLIREEGQEGNDINLNDIPLEGGHADGDLSPPNAGSEQELFVSDDSDDSDEEKLRRNKSKSHRAEFRQNPTDVDDVEADKKKLALNTTYDGFSIYGKILCLVVKRRGMAKGKELAGGAGKAMMEEWIASTQMGEGRMMDD